MFSDFRSETRFNFKVPKAMAAIYDRLINQYKFKKQTIFSARFDKQDEDGQMLDQIELFINLKINQNLTEFDIGNFDIESSLENQIQKQEMKDT